MIQKITDMDISVYYIAEVKLNDTDKIQYIKNITSIIDTVHTLEYTIDIKNALHMSEMDTIILGKYLDATHTSHDINNITFKRHISIDFCDDNHRSGITDYMTTNDSIDISLVVEPPTLIYGWEDLSKVPESHTHKIDIRDPKDCSGYIVSKFKDDHFNYLSTHTFYGYNCKMYAESTKRLQDCGFNIVLDNWDKEEDGAIEPETENTNYDVDIIDLNIDDTLSKLGNAIFPKNINSKDASDSSNPSIVLEKWSYYDVNGDKKTMDVFITKNNN